MSFIINPLEGTGLVPATSAAADLRYLYNLPGIKWARNAVDYDKRTSPVYDVSPLTPTVTFTSSGGAATLGTTFTFDSARISKVSSLSTWYTDANVSGGYYPPRSGGIFSFNLQDSAFEIRLNRQNSNVSRGVSIFVDGKILTTSQFSAVYPSSGTVLANNSTSPQWMKVNFGTDTATYEAVRVQVASGGTSGYAVGDTVTLAGGTGTPAVVKVTSVNGSGVIQAVQVFTPGSYTATPLPSNPVAQASTSGAGVNTPTPTTFNVWFSKKHTTRTTKRIDVIVDYGITISGLSCNSNGQISPVNYVGPKLLIAGDSITEYQLSDYAGGTWSYQVAKRLGLFDRFINFGTSGRRWTATGGDVGFIAGDQADLITQAPDLCVIALGTNDYQGTVAQNTLQTAVTTAMTSLLAALPNTLFVLVGGFTDDTSGTYNGYISSAVTSLNSTRVGFVNFFNLIGGNGYGVSSTSPWNSFYGSTNDIHPSQAGHDTFASILAPAILSAFSGLTL